MDDIVVLCETPQQVEAINSGTNCHGRSGVLTNDLSGRRFDVVWVDVQRFIDSQAYRQVLSEVGVRLKPGGRIVPMADIVNGDA